MVRARALSTTRARLVAARPPAAAHAPVMNRHRAHARETRCVLRAVPDVGAPAALVNPSVISVAGRLRIVGVAVMPVILQVIVAKGTQTVMTTSVIPRIMTTNVIPRDVRVVVADELHSSVIKRVAIIAAA